MGGSLPLQISVGYKRPWSIGTVRGIIHDARSEGKKGSVSCHHFSSWQETVPALSLFFP